MLRLSDPHDLEQSGIKKKNKAGYTYLFESYSHKLNIKLKLNLVKVHVALCEHSKGGSRERGGGGGSRPLWQITSVIGFHKNI